MRRLIVCAAIGVRLFFGQTTGTPSFDAASVKVSATPDGHTSSHSGPGGVEMSNVTLRFLITRAYRIVDPEVFGPAWIDEDRYNIIAKSPAGVPETQIPDMLRTLLAERFKLAVHREKRELPVYALGVAKKGPKLTKADPTEPEPGMSSSYGTVSGRAVTMTRLAGFLAAPYVNLGLPVLDQTNLEGIFNFDLKWTPERPLDGKNENRAPDPNAPPPLFIALEEQLGLKLEKR